MVLYASSKRFVFTTISKNTTIQSQIARITLFTLRFQFLFDVRNDESYFNFTGTVLWIEKVGRRNYFNSNIKS